MKKITILTMFLAGAVSVKAQNSSNAGGVGAHKANLQLSNAIEISFTSSNNTANIEFASITDMLNGLESAAYEVKVRSNKKFRVSVKQSSNTFTYSGTDPLGSTMLVSNVLKVLVTENSTGGYRPWLAQIFGWQSFNSLNIPVTLISDCSAGANQTFAVKYKATPGLNFIAGTYTADMVYTATQE